MLSIIIFFSYVCKINGTIITKTLKKTSMRRFFKRLPILMASAGLTLLGFNGCCNSKKVVSDQSEIEKQRLEELRQRELEAMKQDSIRRAYEDSIRMVRMSQTKTVYGGPTMMGRKFRGDSTNVNR